MKQMAAIFAVMTLSVTFSHAQDQDPCEQVRSVLKRSSYFTNVSNDNSVLGYVMFESTPIAQVMSYSSADKEDLVVVPKHGSGDLVGPVHIRSLNDKCIFITEMLGVHARVMGHEIKYVDPNSVEFVVDPNDKEIFFSSSKLIPITDEKELISVQEKFKD